MPRVPYETQQFSENVGGIGGPGPGEFGQVGSAMHSAGAQIAGAGLDVYNSIKSLDSNNQAANAFYADKSWGDQRYLELKHSSPDGFMHEDFRNPSSPRVKNSSGKDKTIEEQFHEEADVRYQKTQDGLGDQMAVAEYKSRALPFFTGKVSELTNDSKVLNFYATKNSGKQTSQSLSGLPEMVPVYGPIKDLEPVLNKQTGKYEQAYSREDYFPSAEGPYVGVNANRMYDSYNTLAEDQLANVPHAMNLTEYSKDMTKYGQILSGGVAEQGITQAIIGHKENLEETVPVIDSWLEMLRGEDPQSKYNKTHGAPYMAAMLEPMHKEQLIRRLNALRGAAKVNDMDNYNKAVKDFISDTARGYITDQTPLTQKYLLQKTEELNKANPGHEVHFSDNIGRLIGAPMEGMVKKPEVMGARIDAINNIISHYEEVVRVDPQGFAKQNGIEWNENIAAGAYAALEDVRYSLIQKVKAERSADPVKFSIEPREDLKGQAVMGALGIAANNIDFKDAGALKRVENAKVWQQGASRFETKQKNDYRELTLDQRRAFISKNQSSDIAAVLASRDINETDKAEYINALANMTGARFERVVSQVTKDNPDTLKGSWKLIGMHAHDSKESQAFVISAIQGGVNEGKEVNTNLDASVRSLTASWIQSQVMGDPFNHNKVEMSEAIRKTIYNGATMLQQAANDPGNPEIYAKASFDRIIGHHTFQNAVGSGGFFSFGKPGTPARADYPTKIYKGQYISPDMNRVYVNNQNEVLKHFDTIFKISPQAVSMGEAPMTYGNYIDYVRPRLILAPDKTNGDGYLLSFTDDEQRVHHLQRINIHGELEDIHISKDDLYKTNYIPVERSSGPRGNVPAPGPGPKPTPRRGASNQDVSAQVLASNEPPVSDSVLRERLKGQGIPAKQIDMLLEIRERGGEEEFQKMFRRIKPLKPNEKTYIA